MVLPVVCLAENVALADQARRRNGLVGEPRTIRIIPTCGG